MSTIKTDEVQTATDVVPSIPAIRLPGAADPAPAPASRVSTKDRLKGMKKAPAVKTEVAKRPEYEAPKEAVEALARFIPADIIRKTAEKRADNSNTEVSEVMLRAFCAALWKNKVVPSNPKIIVRDGAGQPDMSAIFQVQDRFSKDNMKIPSVSNDAEEEDVVAGIVAALVEAGVEEEYAAKLVSNEIETQKRRNIRSLNELALGHYGQDKQWVEATASEVEVANKLMDFLDTLSEEEQAIIRRDEMRVTVKKDFLTRVCQYTRFEKDDPRGEAQVRAILTIFEPTNFVSHAQIGLSDDEQTKVVRLQQAANELIGSTQIK